MATTRPELLHVLQPVWHRWVDRTSRELLQGMTGEVLRRHSAPFTLNDLQELLLPGLAALGVAGECVPLMGADAATLRRLRERLRRGIHVPLLRFAPEDPASDGTDATGEAGDDAGHSLIACTVIAPGEEATLAEAVQHCTHALRMCRARHVGSRSARVRAVLLRWVAFATAMPERIVTAEEADRERREQAASFLELLAGRKRDPIAVRLRHAARYLRAGAVETSLFHVRDAALRALHLPQIAQTALLSREDVPLSDLQRRELIYLARAGTRELRVLAARRLRCEPAADAQTTCEQLRAATDLWVRRAAR
ncbi:MAG: hypothetical protein RMJ43_08260 [Chloroherpetonaceae bacterium]|nr:hypothetical protein [Chthonomonadaceae bacterium]MDW8207815.1 hypothetical protein [Chloroherpetonaceae bacterium]